LDQFIFIECGIGEEIGDKRKQDGKIAEAILTCNSRQFAAGSPYRFLSLDGRGSVRVIRASTECFTLPSIPSHQGRGEHHDQIPHSWLRGDSLK
jgi:hypothetical protein